VLHKPTINSSVGEGWGGVGDIRQVRA
jgi:hypothetical protein